MAWLSLISPSVNNKSLVEQSELVETQGWRSGRPLEDPHKQKRWGFITAKPAEFLVHCRRGQVLRSSGQGATCFKWPWDSVAVVPTSFQRTQFVADQITLERIGVAVTGLAVYRIAHPLLAYRVLNFSYPERAQQKLAATLTEMLIGSTRRLVANLTVDECLQQRKAALADELLREIAPVLGGEGRADDFSEQGWGVVLDTVEIQEVRVLSSKVFSAMQEPYRASLDRRAREARADAEKHSALSEASARREIQQSRIDTDAAIRASEAMVGRRETEEKSQDVIHQHALRFREEEARSELAIKHRELEAEEERAEIASHERKMEASTLRADRHRAEHALELEHRRAQAELSHTIGKWQAEVAVAEAGAAKERAAAKAKLVTAENLPALAAAVGQRFGEVKVTSIGGDNNAFGSIAQAVASVMELVKEH